MSMTQTNTTEKPQLKLAEDQVEARSPDYYVLSSNTLREFSELMTEVTDEVIKKPKKVTSEEREAVLALAEASARGLNTVLIRDSTLLNNKDVSKHVQKAYGIKKSSDTVNSIQVAQGVDATLQLLKIEQGMDDKKIQKHFVKEAAPRVEDIVDGSLSALVTIAEVREESGEGGLEATPFLKEELEKAEQAFDRLDEVVAERELVAA